MINTILIRSLKSSPEKLKGEKTESRKIQMEKKQNLETNKTEFWKKLNGFHVALIKWMKQQLQQSLSVD